MEQKPLITKKKIELAGQLHEILWKKLMAELAPEQIRLVQIFDGLSTWSRDVQSADTGSMEQQRILDSLEETMQKALDLLPEADWPLAVYDVYPRRMIPETWQARTECLRIIILDALLKLPIEERINVLSMVGRMPAA